jgi:hypothetical protein
MLFVNGSVVIWLVRTFHGWCKGHYAVGVKDVAGLCKCACEIGVEDDWLWREAGLIEAIVSHTSRYWVDM